MSDKQEPGDEIQQISHKFQSVTTLEPGFNATTSMAEQAKPVKMNNAVSPEEKMDSGRNTEEKSYSTRNLPELNLPEKILLVIDTAREREFTGFKLKKETNCSPLTMIRRVVENFVCAKSAIQATHEFALMILDGDGARWVCDFTSNTKTVLNKMSTLTEEVLKDEHKSYDLGQLFERIEPRLPLPQTDQDGGPAKFVTRVILIYARSNSVPCFHTGKKYLDRLTENPYFFLDALFVHERSCDENACDEVFAGIAALDTTNFSYILEVGRSAAKLYDNMAMLLAHPLQRPPQRDARYSIEWQALNDEPKIPWPDCPQARNIETCSRRNARGRCIKGRPGRRSRRTHWL